MQYLSHVQGFGRNPLYICSAPNSRPMNCGIVIMLFHKFTELHANPCAEFCQRSTSAVLRGSICGLSGVQSVCTIRCETYSLHPMRLRASSEWGPTLGADTDDCAVCVIEGLSLP